MTTIGATTTGSRGEGAKVHHHLLTARVENRAGVLVRIAGLFARRNYNIISLAVAPTDDPRFSRISVVVEVEASMLQQVVDQLNKLINVVEITELHPDDACEAELMMATVAGDQPARTELAAITTSAGGSIIDSGPDSIMVMLAGSPEVLDAFEQRLRPFGIRDLQRTGAVALRKLSDRG
jgi:acetolactate synthase-1/3 small subunit